MCITHEPYYPFLLHARALISVLLSSYQISKCLYFRLETHTTSKLEITLTPHKPHGLTTVFCS